MGLFNEVSTGLKLVKMEEIHQQNQEFKFRKFQCLEVIC